MAREWFTNALIEIFPELYGELRARPVTGRMQLSGRGPLGQPGHILGRLSVVLDAPASRQSMLYSERSWPRFLASLAEYPEKADPDITPLDDRGDPVHRLDGSAAVYLTRLAPGWVGFGFTALAADTDWPDSPQVQDQWAGFVREQAARIGAHAGVMTDDSDVEYQPSLEYSLLTAGGKVTSSPGIGYAGSSRCSRRSSRRAPRSSCSVPNSASWRTSMWPTTADGFRG